ncbi:putative membrane translocator [Actinacidiphila reveromycinica]|uniref:Putative membrane translocator n=1 Tax=Actinacidiphila reveromycinica TaxID=659352 RepID=A0A7U3VLS7_9ACTN|nr:class III lanthionine synthetase LanKC [Streptomyces sp. SN-593]BBA95848.1 putative membrane translocator [Streptomyces sp. SN-593]
MIPFLYVVADKEFYAPLETARDRGEVYRPAGVPDGWAGTESGIWTMWHRGRQLRGVEDGWKVHVSARPGRQQHVLDTVAAVCFEQDVAFKHMSCSLAYWWMHHKQAARQQSGKFVAAYPTDVEAARALMERLRTELDGEQGPFVLTDRRYRDSRTVHYRYGAYLPRDRVNADGTYTMLLRRPDGVVEEDHRGVSFHLPEGVVDPFVKRRPAAAGTKAAAPRRKAGTPRTEPVTFHGYTFEEALQFSNAGGTYRARELATGRQVFIKEARAHTGVAHGERTAPDQLRSEHHTLTALHAAAPGLAPQPLELFHEWEHDYLVTEFIEGETLQRWMVAHQPMLGTGRLPHEFDDYYARCEKLLERVESALERLHAAGYLFVDVSPGNVMVGEDDSVRLVDFEAAQRADADEILVMGTPGYSPPPELVGDDRRIHDDFGLAGLALLLLGPFHQSARRNPDALAHLRGELLERAPLPEPLWQKAVRFHPPRAAADGALPLPSPEEVAADPLRHLADLRDRTADALVAMAEPDHPDRVFPTIADGYRTNTQCLAYGSAGVLHALTRAGRALPDGALERLRTDAFDRIDRLGPGLMAGTAGIAWVLADHGLLDEARDLLAAADRHPLITSGASATLFGGSSGLALAHLAVYGHTRDAAHVERAAELAAALPSDAGLAPLLGADDATGLMHGRTGIALMLQQLAAVTGSDDGLERGVRLLHAELDRATDPDAPGLAFPISATDSRSLPYLYSGSASMAHAVVRYTRTVDDERLAQALPRLLASTRTTYTAMSGLFQGLAGLGFALAEQARLTGERSARADAVRGARGLFKFAVPHPTGVRFLGDQLMRFSADLWSGSAGILLFLTQLLDPAPDPLFTVDALSGAHARTPAAR